MATAVTGVTLDIEYQKIDINDTFTITATVLPEDATNKNVTWNSSNTSIATITATDNKCVVTPVNTGYSTITVTTEDGEFTASCNVNVTKITGVIVNKESITIAKDDVEHIVGNTMPVTAVPKPITWSSSDTSIATVDENGNVTGIGNGECVITASVLEFSTSCNVRVATYPTKIIVTPEFIQDHIIGETEPETLTVTFEPEDAEIKDIVWTSSDNDVCTFDESTNKIVYNGPGTCYINASNAKDVVGSCNIKAYQKLDKPGLPETIDIGIFSIELLEVPGCVYSIDNGETWQSSPLFENLQYLHTYEVRQKSVSSNEYYLDSLPSDVLRVTTKDAIHVSSVKLNVNKLELDVGDDPYEFSVQILPENASIKDLIFSFSNESIATIDDNVLTPIRGGIGTFTVTSVDGGKTDSCQVAIYEEQEISISPIITRINKSFVIVKKEYPNQIFGTVSRGKVTMLPTLTGNTIQLDPSINNWGIVTQLTATEYKRETPISEPVYFNTTVVAVDGKTPTNIYLNASILHFNISDNNSKYATLIHTIGPIDTGDKNVAYSSSDSSIVSVDGFGKLTAHKIGKAIITVQAIAGNNVRAYCTCYVYEERTAPQTPTSKSVKSNSVELNPVDGCEYSLDGINWQDSTLFEELTEDSYYNFFQRYKAIDDYQPASGISSSLTVKTLPIVHPDGTSPSGYKWGQKVEVNKIPVFGSPYSKSSDFKVSGIYFIYNINEANHRIRITNIEKYIDVPGHSVGWVNIADLKLIADEIYVGNRVIVSGDINTNADGSGISIHKEKADMYITDIIGTYEYGYGVTDKPGKNRVGFAKRNMITKYNNVIIRDND